MRTYSPTTAREYVNRAKRKMIVSPHIGGAGVGSTASSEVGRIPLFGDMMNPGQREQRERDSGHLAFTIPSNPGRSTMPGLPGLPGTETRNRATQAIQDLTNQQQLVMQQIQEEDALNRYTSDEATQRAKELFEFFG